MSCNELSYLQAYKPALIQQHFQKMNKTQMFSVCLHQEHANFSDPETKNWTTRQVTLTCTGVGEKFDFLSAAYTCKPRDHSNNHSRSRPSAHRRCLCSDLRKRHAASQDKAGAGRRDEFNHTGVGRWCLGVLTPPKEAINGHVSLHTWTTQRCQKIPWKPSFFLLVFPSPSSANAVPSVITTTSCAGPALIRFKNDEFHQVSPPSSKKWKADHLPEIHMWKDFL